MKIGAKLYTPEWAGKYATGLDQFFTKPAVAKYCYNTLMTRLSTLPCDPFKSVYIEPSAGAGVFLKHLPKGRRIAIDLDVRHPEVIKSNFLNWAPPHLGNFVVLGNPPFGRRGWQALAFINHAAQFAHTVALILPAGFTSNARHGSLQSRVASKMTCIHSEPLEQNSFHSVDGKDLKVNCVFQIYTSLVKPKAKKIYTCERYLDLFTIDTRPTRRCGHERFNEADFYLQRTFFKEAPHIHRSYQSQGGSGYGLVLRQDKRDVTYALRHTDWSEYSRLSADSRRHICKGHIQQSLVDQGFHD